MSDDLYATRLYWDGRRGCAKHRGAALALQACPLGREVAEVDYVPALRVFQVRPSAGGWRDMQPAEMARCRALLDEIATAAWAPLGGVPC